MNKTLFTLWRGALTLALLAVIFLGGSPASAQQEEWRSYPLPNGLQLFDFAFADASTGWAVGVDNILKQAVVYHTTDGGETWAEQARWPQAGYYFFAVAFSDAQVGYAAGGIFGQTSTPLIARTEDGGATWQAVTTPESGMINKLTLVPGGGIWARGYYPWPDEGVFIWYSPDGLTFSPRTVTTPTDGEINEVVFPTAQTGYAFGKIGKIGTDNPVPLALKTVDGGDTWTELNLPLSEGVLDDAYFFDEQTGFVAGSSSGQGVILKTSDGGATWSEAARVSGSKVFFTQIKFANNQFGCTLGYLLDDGNHKNLVLATTNGGMTWNEVLRTDDEIITLATSGNSVFFSTYNKFDTGAGIVFYPPLPPSEPPVEQSPVEQPPEAPQLTDIEITPTNATLTVGQSQTFTAKGIDQFGNPMPMPLDNPIFWSVDGEVLPECQGQSTCTFTPTEAGELELVISDGYVECNARFAVADLRGCREAFGFNCSSKPLPPETSLSLLAIVFGAVYVVQRRIAPPKNK